MVRVDRDGRSLTWNDAAAHVLAPEVTLAPGVPLLDAFDDSATVRELLDRSLSGEQVSGVRVDLRSDDGRPRSVRLTLVPLEGSPGAGGATVLLRDLTEEVALRDALEREQ